MEVSESSYMSLKLTFPCYTKPRLAFSPKRKETEYLGFTGLTWAQISNRCLFILQ